MDFNQELEGLVGNRRQEVWTHSSLDGRLNNERLAFLGDAVIELAARSHLFGQDDGKSEAKTKGALTEDKRSWVRNDRLAKLANTLRLRPPNLGGSMKKVSPNETVMAQLYEAALGAVFLERGLDEATRLFLSHWEFARRHPTFADS